GSFMTAHKMNPTVHLAGAASLAMNFAMLGPGRRNDGVEIAQPRPPAELACRAPRFADQLGGIAGATRPDAVRNGLAGDSLDRRENFADADSTAGPEIVGIARPALIEDL